MLVTGLDRWQDEGEDLVPAGRRHAIDVALVDCASAVVET